MMRPTPRLTVVFLLALGIGYALSYAIMLALDAPFRFYGYTNLTFVAVLFALLMLVWLDEPLKLNMLSWAASEIGGDETGGAKPAQGGTPAASGPAFPHDKPSEHWQIDFGDSKQTYEGADLPIWILAGWAAFILWAVIYLISGLPSAF